VSQAFMRTRPPSPGKNASQSLWRLPPQSSISHCIRLPIITPIRKTISGAY